MEEELKSGEEVSQEIEDTKAPLDEGTMPAQWPDPGAGGDYQDPTVLLVTPSDEEAECECECDCVMCKNCVNKSECPVEVDPMLDCADKVDEAATAAPQETIDVCQALSAGFEPAIEAQSILEAAIGASDLNEGGSMADELILNACLQEKVADGKWKICIIREGWSLNKRYYPRNVLERDKGKFESVKIAVYGYFPENKNLGHVPYSISRNVPEGLVLNDVGWVENVRTEIENGRMQLVGDFICTDENLDKKLSKIYSLRKDKMPGFSIDAMGEVAVGMAEGRQGLIVKSITQGNEVTLVNQPAAGGKFQQRLVASLDELEADFEILENPNQNNKEKNMDENENVQENLLDSLKAELEAMKAQFVENTKAQEIARQELVDAKRQARLAECKSVLNSRLRESNLNEIACAMIRRDFLDRDFQEAELDQRISDVRDLMASIDGGGTAQIEQPMVSNVSESKDKLVRELELCWGLDTKKLSDSEQKLYEGIRPSFLNVYKHWFDDPSLTWTAGKNALQEATVTSDLPSVMGNTLHRTVGLQYVSQKTWYQDLFRIDTNVVDLKANRKVYVNEVSGGNTVAEGADYQEMSTLKDSYKEYTVAKRGGIYTLTWESLVNDDLGEMKKLAQKITRNAIKELNEFTFGIIIGTKDGGAIGSDDAYDSIDFYHANHFNLGSSALSHTSLNAAVTALSNQYAYGAQSAISDNPLSSSATTINVGSTTGFKAGQFVVIEAEKIKLGTVASATQFTGCTRGVGGTTGASHAQNSIMYHLHTPLALMEYFLLYTPELQDTVDRVLKSPGVSGIANNEFNRNNSLLSSGVVTPMMVPSTYMGMDTNNWYLIAKPDVIDPFYLGFLNNKQAPDVMYADNMLVDPTFLADKYRYKYRHVYSGTNFDWRGAYASIVS